MNDPILALASMPTWLTSDLLLGMRRGIERETLRMQADGYIAKTPHPPALGSALTHPYVTTDYSEALLELITPPLESPQATLGFLYDLHAMVQQHLPAGETLWPLSMPCLLDSEETQIPLAQYGSSNLGQFKTLYRHGLGLRYGRRMQTIAGLHYNLSFPPEFFAAWQKNMLAEQVETEHTTALSLRQFTDVAYLGLIRNFIRLTPLVIYLLGASPAVCACFLTGRKHQLQPLVKGTLHLPYATALRMGKLGYQNSAQRQLGIHYNDLADYIAGIRQAIATPYTDFAALGLDDVDGTPLQINDHVLQLENEYYSLVRPKQVAKASETPAQALEQRGIGYVELRAVDIDPYSVIGIELETACFLEILALSCVLSPSPALQFAEEERISRNQARVVEAGRQPDLLFELVDAQMPFSHWAAQQLEQMQSAAECLDQAHGGQAYQQALQLMQQRIKQPEQTRSAQILTDIMAVNGGWQFGYGLAVEHAATLLQSPMSTQLVANFEQLAVQSMQQQRQIEQSDQIAFKEFLAPYRQHLADRSADVVATTQSLSS